MIDPADVKIRFQEFACESDEKIQVFLDDAIIMLNEAFWDTKYDLGLSYLTAHYLALANRDAAGSSSAIKPSGPIASKSVDGVSVSYAVMASDDDWENFYKTTTYGQRYLALTKTLGIAAYVI